MLWGFESNRPDLADHGVEPAATPSGAGAEVFEAGPGDDIETMINALEPGDELVLAGGMYSLTGP